MAAADCWTQLAESAKRMADAARQHDWDALIDQYGRFSAIADTLPRMQSTPISDADRRARARLIRDVLADFDAVREQVGPWMTDVRPLLDGWQRSAAPRP